MGSSEKKLKAPETVLRHLQYVQRRVFHDQLEQLPNTTDPLEVLRTGRGKCGHVALALSYLLDRSGMENRMVRLLKHIVVEARWDGRWHLLDADLFKHGVVPASDDGSIPSLREVQGNYLIDRFPPTMYVYTREYVHFRRKPDHVLRGFIEHHQAGFMSHYYQMNLGLPLEYHSLATKPSLLVI